MKLAELKGFLEDRRKNRVLQKYRAAILRRHYTELCTIIDFDRFGGYFNANHFAELIHCTDKLRIIVIAHKKTWSPEIEELKTKGNLEIRFLPHTDQDFGTEWLVGDNVAFISDGEIHSIIECPDFAADLRKVFDWMWPSAEEATTGFTFANPDQSLNGQ